jgi:mRNA interferase RelE/StbE
VAAVVPVEDVAALEALEHEHDAAELRARVAEWEAEGRATIRIGEIAVRYGLEISKSGWRGPSSSRLRLRRRQRIYAGLLGLARDPFSAQGVKALHGGGYRLRVGDYRVLYQLDSGRLVVLVVGVGGRREIYGRR